MTTPEREGDCRFPPEYRLKKSAQFQAVFDQATSVADQLLVVYVAANELPHPRIGLTVSRKAGNAVVRNLYKRRLREAFRLQRRELPAGYDFVLMPRRGNTPKGTKPKRKAVPTLERLAQSMRQLTWQAVAKWNLKQNQTPTQNDTGN